MYLRDHLKHVPGLKSAVHLSRKLLHGPTPSMWLRIVMDRETHSLIQSLDPPNLSALEISGGKWQSLGFRKYQSVDFPSFDICINVLDERFDIIIAEQVFEHLLWPYRAAKNVYEMLNPNGSFLITTPFLVRVHRIPEDCSRWTEVGIRYFLAEAGFDIDRIVTGSWGNRACIRSNWTKWTIYSPWLHSLKNEPDYPIAVWALARK